MPECEQDKSKHFLIEEVYEMAECEQDKSKLFNRRGVYIYMRKLSLLFYWAINIYFNSIFMNGDKKG